MVSIESWLLAHRTTVRLAFILRLVALAVGSAMGLLWTRLLLAAMGAELYGLFLSFNAVTRLGGLGELGLTGTVGLKAGQYLGEGNTLELRKLLATSRSVFGLLAAVLATIFVVCSPWLPTWFHFQNPASGGSLTLLFATAGFGAAVTIVSGYFSSLNYAYGTVTWPILPPVIFSQIAAPFCHWWLAAAGAPLWLQNMPYLIAGTFTAFLVWRMLKWSHPFLGDLFPLAVDRPTLRLLFSTGGWMYLAGLGGAIYQTVDRLVINAYFGADQVPSYQVNYKLCELSLTLITTATFVAAPKLTQWIASTPIPYKRLQDEIGRLRTFQVALSLGAALGYLWINENFIRWWVGGKFEASPALEAAFATVLVVAGCGECGTAIAARCGKQGIRNYGLSIGLSGLLNLLLSLLAARSGWLAGVAVATAISQGCLILTTNYLCSVHLRIPYTQWLTKVFAAPLAAILCAAGLRQFFSSHSLKDQVILACLYLFIWAAGCRLAGMSMRMIRTEIAFFQQLLSKR